MNYRRKARPVEARQVSDETAADIAYWCGGKVVSIGYDNQGKSVLIPTFEGTNQAMPGDWVLRGPDNVFYVRTDAQFKMNYELADG